LKKLENFKILSPPRIGGGAQFGLGG